MQIHSSLTGRPVSGDVENLAAAAVKGTGRTPSTVIVANISKKLERALDMSNTYNIPCNDRVSHCFTFARTRQVTFGATVTVTLQSQRSVGNR